MNSSRKARRKRKAAQEKRRRREKSKKREQGQILAPTFHVLPNPFDGLSIDQRRLAIKEIAKTSDEAYQGALSELTAVLRRHNPLHVLSHMAYYGLRVDVDETKGVTKLDSDCEIFPFHVEILQAILLQIAPEKLSGTPFPPQELQQVWDQVKTLCDTHNIRQFNPAGLQLSDEERAIAFTQHLMRGATQAVRNWGYHSQIKRLARELYCPFDEKLVEARQFSVSDVFDVFEAVFFEVGSRQTGHRKTLVNLFNSSGTSARLLVKDYHELIGLSEAKAEKFIEKFNEKDVSLNHVRAMIVAHYDLRLPNVYAFLATDLAKSLGLDDDRVCAVLDEYALSFGALSEYQTEHLHLSNPVWEKPVVKLGAGEYFCALPAGFFSFVIPCMEAVLAPFAPAVSDQRAEFLESKVVEIVKRRFPSSQIKNNFKWVKDETTYETDLIAFIDSFALLIECKSGKITPSALRGAPDRLRKHIRELLIDPNLQSLRLKQHLEFLSSHANVADSIRDQIGYDLGNVRKVVRVSVCLEDFGPIQSCLKLLEDTGWLPTDFEPCPTMNLADFETVFDILDHPVQILHYLMRREATEGSFGYLADEIDLLGLYITTLLNIDDVGPDVDFVFTGMSAPLDAYYNSLDEGVALDKPRPANSPLFADIFSQLEQRGFARWTEIGVALNMFSPDDQIKITKQLAKRNCSPLLIINRLS